MSSPVALPIPGQLTAAEHVAGRSAVLAARLLLATARRRPAAIRRVLNRMARGARQASNAEAQRAHLVVTSVSFGCAGPHGCLPRSLAAVLLARASGKHVTWIVGVNSPPPASHAWIEADGNPVGEPIDPRRVYHPIITI